MEMTRRSLVKVLAIGVPAAAVTGHAGLAALAGAAVGTAIVRPQKPIERVSAGEPMSAEWANALVDAVNHANGFTDELRG